jgi:hypothetical protein
MSSSQHRLQPAYSFVTDERQFTLACADARVAIGDDAFVGDGQAVLQVSPQPSVLLKADIRNVPPGFFSEVALVGSREPTGFEFHGTAIPGFSGGVSGQFGRGSTVVVWHPQSEPVVGIGDDATEMSHVIFHLFNSRDFVTLNGLSERRGDVAVSINRVDLRHFNIGVSIESLFESHEIQKRLRAEGGCRMTHVGSLQHADGSLLTGRQAADYLTQLNDFLSFANGQRCYPVCACGFGVDGNRVWEAWSSPSVGRGWTDSWFD